MSNRARRGGCAGASYTPSKPLGTRPIQKMRIATAPPATCDGITRSSPGLPMESSCSRRSSGALAGGPWAPAFRLRAPRNSATAQRDRGCREVRMLGIFSRSLGSMSQAPSRKLTLSRRVRAELHARDLLCADVWQPDRRRIGRVVDGHMPRVAAERRQMIHGELLGDRIELRQKVGVGSGNPRHVVLIDENFVRLYPMAVGELVSLLERLHTGIELCQPARPVQARIYVVAVAIG